MRRIAVTYNEENKEVFAHFGHTNRFKIYDCENDAIVDTFEIATEGHGHQYLPEFLYKLGVEEVICGNLGAGMFYALQQYNIKVCGGVSGEVDETVKALLNGELRYTTEYNCGHHSHDGCGCHSHAGCNDDSDCGCGCH